MIVLFVLSSFKAAVTTSILVILFVVLWRKWFIKDFIITILVINYFVLLISCSKITYTQECIENYIPVIELTKCTDIFWYEYKGDSIFTHTVSVMEYCGTSGSGTCSGDTIWKHKLVCPPCDSVFGGYICNSY
jgi:hypothetical protein